MAAKALLSDFLAAHHVMTLATLGPEGSSAAAVFYAHSGTTLYFLSSPTTRHAINCGLHPRASITIQHDQPVWQDICGLQATVIVRQLAGAEKAAAQACYRGRFPDVFDLARMPLKVAEAMNSVAWYAATIEWARLIDNAKGFGFKTEWTLQELAG